MMAQELIVGALVAYAFYSVTKRYLPKAARRALRALLARAAAMLGLAAWVRRLTTEPAASSPSCADSCSNCGGCGLSGRVKSEGRTNAARPHH
jgi:hypothetical protein